MSYSTHRKKQLQEQILFVIFLEIDFRRRKLATSHVDIDCGQTLIAAPQHAQRQRQRNSALKGLFVTLGITMLSIECRYAESR